jgi:hypothetical protein
MSKFDHKLELHCGTISFITAPFSASIGEWERVAPVIYRTSFFSRNFLQNSTVKRDVLLRLLADKEAKEPQPKRGVLLPR